MRRLLLAGVVGAAVATGAVALVVAFTDVRVTTATNTTTVTSGSKIAGRTPPPCSPNASLNYGFNQPQGSTGALMIPMSISLAKGPPCTLDGNALFEIQPQDVHASIGGNPQNWHLDGAIRDGAGLSSIFVWRNWCGPHGRFRFKLTVQGNHGTAFFTDHDTPPCEGPGHPSTLDRLPISG